MYATSHKKPFVPSVGSIGLLCNVEAFVESLWLEGENFDVSPYRYHSMCHCLSETRSYIKRQCTQYIANMVLI